MPPSVLRRVRRVVVVLFVAATVLVAWNAVDAQRSLTVAFQDANGSAVDSFIAGGDRLNQWDAAKKRHDAAVGRAWERAAKVEFIVLAVAVCVWLLLPRAAAAT